MLTGWTPPEPTVSTGVSDPSKWIRRTDTWLLPASTASRRRPSALRCSDPCDASPAPLPAPPAAKGDPGSAVSVPSAWRARPATVFVPEVLSLTYRWPTTGDLGAAAAGDAPTAARRTSRTPAVVRRGRKRM